GGTQSGNKITLGLGQTASCTITNNDIAPTLIVKKHVINDNGGTMTAANFTMSVTGASPNPSSFAGSETGTTVALKAGNYSVNESGPSGYAGSSSADCSGSIGLAETKTCTITNDDQQGTLTIIKHVINDNGGAAAAGDFTMHI